MNPQEHASSPVPWPPIVFGSALAGAIVLSFFAPLPFLPPAAVWSVGLLGLMMLAGGVALAAAAAFKFTRAATPIAPTRPTATIVTEGVYRRTRNPMYLGFSIVLAAMALTLDSLWFVIATPLAVLAVTKLAIEPEERYLAQKFGASYEDYRTRVRRWL